MKNKGISGFGVIFILIILFLAGYVTYQIVRVHIAYGAIKQMVEDAAEIGPVQTDYEILKYLTVKAKEQQKIELAPDSIFIDHSNPDSFRICVIYSDSSSIFGLFQYTRHFVIDKTAPIKVRF